MAVVQAPLGAEVLCAIQEVDFEHAHQRYWDQDECVFLEHFLSPKVVEQHLLPQLEPLRSDVHRSYIPRHKKGGSVSYYTLAAKAPVFLELYRSPAFIAFVSRLVDRPVMPCPEDDPHACALYFYTEPGDHIGFHYDTSYYKGARYTVLMGLVQRSTQCRLVCQLHKDDPTRPMQELRLCTEPGSMVIFNGNKLWHAITPLEADAERIVLTMEYVTNPEMGPFQRFISNMKDAIAYFGFSAVLRGRRSHSGQVNSPTADRWP
ncbi:MAG TPA: 2OG-Fe(II) oxygenase [Alphaproteobacteria bacterium]|nr:2OG-Fe(II) oxygenase [Alphaproteobacteria bacterium]